MVQKLAILGSTGSIGKQTLDIVDSYPDRFEVDTLTACDNWQELVVQAIKYDANTVVIANQAHYGKVKEALSGTYTKVFAGKEALVAAAASTEVDTVVSALVGFAGLMPTLSAIKNSKKIALANKETLVVAGETVIRLSKEHNAPIVPVDSEHSAIFQCLSGEYSNIEKIILTASGGPFRGYSKEQLEHVTPEQALAHPNWVMGNKITIDSATLMNKGFEMIEAKWLFDVKPSQIEVTIHPGSVVHSMVQFTDGAIKAQLGCADMRLPIQYALTFPERIAMQGERLDFSKGLNLSFSPPDTDTFLCLSLAYEALRRGGNSACVMNAANEIAVSAFLSGGIALTHIPTIISSCMEKIDFVSLPTIDDYLLTDNLAREYAKHIIKNII